MPLGYILVGGSSRRMRRDKALLPWYQGPLVAHLATELRQLCHQVALVGAERPGLETYRVIPDCLPGVGPLGGIATALAEPGEYWRLVLSCDLPLVNKVLLEELLALRTSAECNEIDLVAPETDDGRLQPLCGLWHARVGPLLARHLHDIFNDPTGDHRQLSVLCFAQTIRTMRFRPADPSRLRNINTMRDYLAALAGHPSPEDEK